MKNVASQIFILLNSNNSIIFIFVQKFNRFIKTLHILTKLSIIFIVKFRKRVKFVQISNEELLRKKNNFKNEMNIQDVRDVFINEKLLTRHFEYNAFCSMKLMFQRN